LLRIGSGLVERLMVTALAGWIAIVAIRPGGCCDLGIAGPQISRTRGEIGCPIR
jgi:hypothetical protein